MKCYYHKADFDGICSAAIVKLFEPTVELIGVNYGDNVDLDIFEPGERCYIVDFSFPLGQMKALCEVAEVIWIDHHHSAIEANKDLITSGHMLEIGKAGCELTWTWFHGSDVALPGAVHLLGRYDVWDWMNHPGSLEFQYGIRNSEVDTGPNNSVFWKKLFTDSSFVASIIMEGRTLLRYEQKQNERYIKSCGFTVEFEGYTCLAVNKGLSNSLIFESVYDPNMHQIMASFVYRKGEWHISLYSADKNIDVSALAMKYGGGGHKQASGFATKVLPFIS